MPVARQPAQSLYTSLGQRKYLTASERARFFDAVRACHRPELRTLCLVLIWTGCRVSEARALTAASVNLDDGFVAVRSLKKRRRKDGTLPVIIREIPVPDELLAELAEVHDLRACESTRKLWTLSRDRMWRLVKGVMAAGGIAPGPHMSPQGLRHSFGVHAVRCGAPLNMVQRWLGHTSMETTAIYLGVMGGEEREIAARMWNQTTHTPAQNAANTMQCPTVFRS